jgi:hypothetical protein
LTDPATGRERRTWAFVMTLCFSRHQYLEFVFDQTVATWLGCHRRAFEWFGRVPERLIIDNPKCAITRACIHDPIVQRSYAECAEGYGFRIEACPPADPAKKGIVEAGVKYVKGNFLPLRQFRDLADLNDQSRHWVMHEAGLRIHGTTREQPLVRFALERPLMKALPDVAPDLGAWTLVSVHRDCHVQFEKSLYSVPFSLVGQRLWLRATDTTVTVFKDHHLVATHLRAHSAATRRTVREHLPPHAQLFFAHDRPGVHSRQPALDLRARNSSINCSVIASWNDCVPHRVSCAWGAVTATRDWKPPVPGPSRTTARITALSARSSLADMTCGSNRLVRIRARFTSTAPASPVRHMSCSAQRPPPAMSFLPLPAADAGSDLQPPHSTGVTR